VFPHGNEIADIFFETAVSLRLTSPHYPPVEESECHQALRQEKIVIKFNLPCFLTARIGSVFIPHSELTSLRDG